MTPQQLKAMKLALEALETSMYPQQKQLQAITAIKEALAEHAMQKVQRLGQEIEQEPVAWLLTDKNINSLQVDSIQRLIDRLKHAHLTDIRVRINGHDEWFEADWLKHMVRVTPPQPEQIQPSADSNTHQPKRHELQAKGEHPAPCARHCEANAFQIVIKNLKAQLAREANAFQIVIKNLKAQLAQRKPLTDEELEAMAENHVTNCYFDTLKFARAIEAAHGIKENT